MTVHANGQYALQPFHMIQRGLKIINALSQLFLHIDKPPAHTEPGNKLAIIERLGEFKLQVHHMKLQKRLLAESDS